MNEEKYLYHYREGLNKLKDFSFKDQVSNVKKLLSDSMLSKNLNILIGSGCSVPAVPLMGATFKKIKAENSKLKLGDFSGNSPDIEGYLNWLNTGINFFEKFQQEDLNHEQLEEYKKSFTCTKKALLNSIPREYLSAQDDNIIKVKELYVKFYNSLFSIRGTRNYPPTNIFTTNYDLFNEVAMEELAIHYNNGFRGNVNRIFDPSIYNLRLVDDQVRYKERWSEIRNYIKLYKIHGSIDWYFEEDKIIQKTAQAAIENVVIYPTINKHLETQQTPYSELFRSLTINLQKPDSTLLVLGYGFPDQHINQLIKQALSNPDFTLIVFGDKNETNAKVFLEEMKSKKNFHFIGGNINGDNIKYKDGHHFSNILNYLGGVINE